MAMLLPLKFKVLHVEPYYRSKAAIEHLEAFKGNMTLHRFLEEIACCTFPLTLPTNPQGNGEGLVQELEVRIHN